MGIKVDRRNFLVAAGAGAAAMSLSELNPAFAEPAAPAPQNVKPELANVKACVFDTFGTVVDWRNSVIAQGMVWGKAKGLNINWVEFADKWRLGYRPIMDKVRNGQLPWTNFRWASFRWRPLMATFPRPRSVLNGPPHAPIPRLRKTHRRT